MGENIHPPNDLHNILPVVPTKAGRKTLARDGRFDNPLGNQEGIGPITKIRNLAKYHNVEDIDRNHPCQ